MDQLQVRSIDILKSSHSHVEISKFSTTMSFEEKIAFQRLILRLSKYVPNVIDIFTSLFN